MNGLKNLNGYSALDLKGTNIAIKNSSTTLNLNNISFTIVITKNSANTEITSEFTIKRSKTNTETNSDQIAAIKAKIKDTNLTIGQDIDTSNDDKISAAIKNQLKINNSSLTNQDLTKITDNIITLTPGMSINVILSIMIDSQSDTIKIIVNRPRTDVEDKILFDKVFALVVEGKKTYPILYMNRTYLGYKKVPFIVASNNPKIKQKILRVISTSKGRDYQIPINESDGFIFGSTYAKISTTSSGNIPFKIKFGNYVKNYVWLAVFYIS